MNDEVLTAELCVLHMKGSCFKFSADRLIEIFLLIFLRKQVQHFMQIVSSGDNLHEMADPVFWEKTNKKTIMNLSSAEFAQSGKAQGYSYANG